MRCIYFDGQTCMAHPPQDRLAYKPNNEEQSKLCNSEGFKTCPRLTAFEDYLKAIAKPSR